jgi:gas vesicle protein
MVVGAGVALLLAPRTGRELRTEIKNRLPFQDGHAAIAPSVS